MLTAKFNVIRATTVAVKKQFITKATVLSTLKNMNGQISASANWTHHKTREAFCSTVFGCEIVRKSDQPIKKNIVVHTGAKICDGGEKEGMFMPS